MDVGIANLSKEVDMSQKYITLSIHAVFWGVGVFAILMF